MFVNLSIAEAEMVRDAMVDASKKLGKQQAEAASSVANRYDLSVLDGLGKSIWLLNYGLDRARSLKG